MADSPKLVVEKREKLGSAESRRLRKRGIVPGNVYGHQKDPVSITTSEEILRPLIMGGIRVVDIDIEGVPEKTMFRDVQWDTFGVQILHFDLIRIDPDERITIEVPVRLRGFSPDQFSGLIVQQPLRSLTIECQVISIPVSIDLRIGDLEVGQSIQVQQVEIPEGTTCQNPPESVVVQIVQPREEVEEADEMDAGPAEPEIVGRKESNEEEEQS